MHRDSEEEKQEETVEVSDDFEKEDNEMLAYSPKLQRLEEQPEDELTHHSVIDFN